VGEDLGRFTRSCVGRLLILSSSTACWVTSVRSSFAPLPSRASAADYSRSRRSLATLARSLRAASAVAKPNPDVYRPAQDQAGDRFSRQDSFFPGGACRDRRAHHTAPQPVQSMRRV